MPPRLGRRSCLLGSLTLAATFPALATPAPTPIRLGILQFGTVQWVAELIRAGGLDRAEGVAVQPVTLANTDAGRIALMAGSADIVVSDWLFAAARTAAGTPLRFAPFSSALGGIMVPAASPIHGLPDLRGRRLGVVGGPADKSWLLVQSAAQETAGLDLATAARIAYGAPPLLEAKLRQGELDAVLTYWNFAARLDASGFREAISVGDCARTLGLPDRLDLVGFVFHADWAEANRAAVDGLLAAVHHAEAALADPATAAASWASVRPLMDAPDDALFASLQRRFIAATGRAPDQATEARTASRLFDLMLRAGGTRATGGLAALPPDLFWSTGA